MSGPSREFATVGQVKIWRRRQRVIGKAEWARRAANPRFVVTSLKPDAWDAHPRAPTGC